MKSFVLGVLAVGILGGCGRQPEPDLYHYKAASRVRVVPRSVIAADSEADLIAFEQATIFGHEITAAGMLASGRAVRLYEGTKIKVVANGTNVRFLTTTEDGHEHVGSSDEYPDGLLSEVEIELRSGPQSGAHLWVHTDSLLPEEMLKEQRRAKEQVDEIMKRIPPKNEKPDEKKQ